MRLSVLEDRGAVLGAVVVKLDDETWNALNQLAKDRMLD
jgi:hypothetical protein